MRCHLRLRVVTENLDRWGCCVVEWWDGAPGSLDACRHPPADLSGGGRLGARVSTSVAASVLSQCAGKASQGNAGESVDAACRSGGGPAEIVARQNAGGGRRVIRDRARGGGWAWRRGARDGLPAPGTRATQPPLRGTRLLV